MFSISDIRNEVYPAAYRRGLSLYESGAATEFSYDIYIENNSPKAEITAKIQESPQDIFNVTVLVDEEYTEVCSSCCNCDAYYNDEGLCSHCVAALLAYVNKRQAVEILREKQQNAAVMHTSVGFKTILTRHSMQAGAAYLLPENVYGKIELEPCFRLEYRYATVTFKIGTEQKYVLKNISAFLKSIASNERVRYGKKLDFYHNKAAFTEKSLRLIEFMELQDADLKRRSRRHAYYIHDGSGYERVMDLDEVGIDRFFEAVGSQTFFAQTDYKETQPCHLADKEMKPLLTINPGSMGIFLVLEDLTVIRGSRFYYFCRDHVFYRSPLLLKQQAEDVFEFLERQTGRSCYISDEEMPIFCRDLLPLLRETFHISAAGFDETLYIPKKPEFQLYLDKLDLHVTGAKLVAVYGVTKYNVLETIKEGEVRDVSEETRIRNLVYPYFNDLSSDKTIFLLQHDEDKLYQLLSGGLARLSEFMEIYTSEPFRKMKVLPAPNVSVGISLKSDLLELSIHSEEMPPDELAYVLSKFSHRKKYIRLKNGDFLDLSHNGLVQLAEVSEALHLTEAGLKKGTIHIPKFRAMYLDAALRNNQFLTVEKSKELKSIVRNMKTIEDSDFDVPQSLKSVMRGYQVSGFLWLKTLRENGFGGILADDMGLGKTLQVISLLLSEYHEILAGEKPARRALIICPASLVYNWQRELERFAPELPVAAVTGAAPERKEIVRSSGENDILITSYDLLKRDTDFYQDIVFSIEVIDEAQYIKNPNTQAAKGVKIITSAFRLALTGTPIENRLSELWSIFDFVMPGFLFSYQRFKRQLETPITVNADEERMEWLLRMIRPFVLRRIKGDVLTDLPEKIEENLYAKMSGEQLILYNAHVQQLKRQLTDQSDKEFRTQKIQILAELTKLRQICCDPALLFDNYGSGCAKAEMCIELIKNAVSGGHKILLFSQFTTMLDRLAALLANEDISYYMLTGAVSKEKRMEMVEHYNQDDVPVFCISLKAGGTGLNLTSADIVIHYDPWWNVAVQDQATDRAHRIGQNHVVTVYKLVSEGTIEEKIISIQERKKKLAQQVLEGEGMNQTSFTKEEILAFLE